MAPTRPPEVDSGAAGSDTTAGDALIAYLAQPLLDLQTIDGDLPGETVHLLRTAARRFRSALTSYRSVLDPGEVDLLREELRWLGRSLAPARDIDVLAGHLAGLVDEGDDESADAPATALRERLKNELRQCQATAHRAAMEALSSPRFEQLVRSLETVLVAASVRPEAAVPARTVLPVILDRERRRVRRMGLAVRDAEPGPHRDEALHDLRKAVKRLRYTSESAVPAIGHNARELSRRATSLQGVLGAHQDTIASRAWLARLAEQLGDDESLASGVARLHALEEKRSRSAGRDHEKALRRLLGTRRTRGWSSSPRRGSRPVSRRR